MLKILPQLQKLFNSVANNDGRRNYHYREILRQEVEKKKQVSVIAPYLEIQFV